MKTLYVANVVGESLIEDDMPVEANAAPQLVADDVLVFYGSPDWGVRAGVLADDEADAERLLIAAFGEQEIDGIETAAPMPRLIEVGLQNLFHSRSRCGDNDCEIHHPEVIEGDERLTAMAWYEAGRLSVLRLIEGELDCEDEGCEQGVTLDAIATLVATYGPNPQEVGVKDGTEDDFGDLIHDAVAALGYNPDAVLTDDKVWEAVQEAADATEATDMADFLDDVSTAIINAKKESDG